MEKIREFISSENGRLAIIAAGALILLLLFVRAASPRTFNLFINSGKDNVYSMKKAKRNIKNAAKKAKSA